MKTRSRSLPRTAADAHGAIPAGGQANASEAATHDRPAVAFQFPSQLLLLEVLRRPLESAQYLSIRYTERLGEAGAVTSVGTRGDSYDNALAESVNGLYKTELIRRRGPWRTVEDVELATLEWVDWWNKRRLHSACGDIPPAEFEALYYTDQAAVPAA